ncbi:MAG TPA: carboxypeptidase regulatory-like domain-containing protein [Candidatus Acidoferrales bacterium]|nr:carboxypeptidase regulatory-like domain-containing protein [Candidatus Acidoferrales bacterium]
MRTVLCASFCVLLAWSLSAQDKPAAKTSTKPGAAPAAAAREVESASGGEAAAAKLPVRRVVLYKSGVGYFEHLGRVRGNQSLTIDFTSGQLNDVLSSLTVLDLGGGKITAVNYNSEAPLAKRLGALRLPLGEQTTLSQFLNAVRGARLEVHSPGAAISGRLLSVERKTRTTKEGQVIPYDEVSLVTDAGEVRTAELGPATSVRLAERDLNQEVGRYLNLIASTRSQDLRRMTISSAGTGDRQVYVSYISEVPLWKTTYRIVLPSKPGAKPLLQGWAIVDNTVGEDWENVELSLVAGAPQSFIQQLSQPYYSRRPVVPLPESVQLEPQTHAETLIPGNGKLSGNVTDQSGASVVNATVRVFDASNNVVASAVTDDSGDYEVNGLPDGTYRVEIASAGFNTYSASNVAVTGGEDTSQDATLRVGSTSETVTVMATPAPAPGSGGGVGGGYFHRAPAPTSETSNRAMLSPGVLNQTRASQQAAAQARELGDLFEYKLKQPVTIRKNQSALVPILQSEVTAEKVSLWNESAGRPQPLEAIWLTNSSGLTLDGGSFTVLEDEAFAGEGLVDPIKPGEKRLLSYAADLGVRVDAKNDVVSKPTTRVWIARGVLVEVSGIREQKTYTVRNEDTHPRTVVIEHPRRPGYKLVGGLEPAETTATTYRFRVPVEPKKTATLTVPEEKPVETRYAVTNLTDDQVAVIARQRVISPEVEEALRKILAQKAAIAALEHELNIRRDETKRIFDDQQRLRENMKALKGSAEEKALVERYTRELNDEEDRLAAIRKESADLQAKLTAAQAELNRMVEALQFKG